MSHSRLLFAATALSVATFPLCLSASTIIGGIHFSGDVTIRTSGGLGSLLFDTVPAHSPFTFTVDSGTGFFSGLSGFGNDMNFGAAAEPIDTPVDVPDFLTFQNTPDTFTLTLVHGGVTIPAGTGCTDVVTNAAPGNACTPPGTPYNLEDIGNGSDSSASFVLVGFLVDGGTDNPATITFSAASTGKSLEQILFDQEHGTADVITYGAQLVTVAPEAGTSSLMLGAFLLLAGGMFRRKKAR